MSKQTLKNDGITRIEPNDNQKVENVLIEGYYLEEQEFNAMERVKIKEEQSVQDEIETNDETSSNSNYEDVRKHASEIQEGFSCNFCEYTAKHRSKSVAKFRMQRHLDGKHQLGWGKYNCIVCGKQFSTRQVLNQHKKVSDHGNDGLENKYEDVKKNATKVLEGFSCNICGSVIRSSKPSKARYNMQKHLDKFHG